MTSSTAETRLAYGLLFLTPLLFSANALTARWVDGSIPPVAMAFWRWALTLVFLVPYAGRHLISGWRELLAEWRVLVLLGFLGMGVCGAPFFARITVDMRTIGVLLLLALVPGIGAFLAYGKLVQMVGPARTGLLLYLGPIYNAVLAWPLLGETIEAYHFAGTALILTGIALATVAPRTARG